ncbi:MAG TPA: aminopeptidase [Bacillota bacterium]|nr:aminopeptidase [Bacillota bacterium]
MFQMALTARRIVETVLGVKPGERVCIVTDTDRSSAITDVLATVVGAAGGLPMVIRMLPHTVGGQEPAPPVAAAMQAAEAVILQDTYALVHTDAFRAAAAKGVRLVEMWGVTEEMMTRGGLLADYAEVARVTNALVDLAKGVKQARMTTAGGTDLTVSVAGRPAVPLIGEALYAGSFASLPGGELAFAPVEGTAEGLLVDPFLLERHDLGYRRESFRLEVRGGRVAAAHGGREAQAVMRMIEENGESAANIAEFALGTNGWCRPYETLREAKKALGTAHVAIGDSRSIGGDVYSPIHMDMIFDHASVTFDGRPVLTDGRLAIG